MSRELSPFVATLRLVIYDQSEVDAQLAAEKIAEEARDLLDEEEGDHVAVTEVLPFTLEVTPQEVIDRLLQARNTLIKTRIKQCFDAARELDYIVYCLQQREESGMAGTNYDHSRILRVADRILNHNESPTD